VEGILKWWEGWLSGAVIFAPQCVDGGTLRKEEGELKGIEEIEDLQTH
jgi:hypothetical protein